MSFGDVDSNCKEGTYSEGLRKSEYFYSLAPDTCVGQQDSREGLLELWSKL